MAKKKSDQPRSAVELLDNPLVLEDESARGGMESTPFDKAYSILTSVSGQRLELMTRTTPKLAAALNLGYNMMYNFRSGYIRGRLDTLMRIHVSMGGKGRAEMVQSLQAGSGVPGEFYDSKGGAMNSFVDDLAGEEPDVE